MITKIIYSDAHILNKYRFKTARHKTLYISTLLYLIDIFPWVYMLTIQ